MDIANQVQKKESKIKRFLKKDSNTLEVGEVLVLTACTVFITGVVTVGINTGVNAIQAVVDSRRNNVE